jgi:hypothetical protein
VELKQVTTDCLLLEPRKRWLIWHTLAIFGLCIAPIIATVFWFIEALENGVWSIFFLSVVLVFMFVLLLGSLSAPGRFKRWVQFDRRAGLLTINRRLFGFRRRLQVVQVRPLRDLVCIQLLYEGFHSTEIGEPGTPGSVIDYRSYQLNLVFDDPKDPRYNLTTHSDWKWMREAGQTLADFLGIPVADQLAHSTEGVR